MFKFDIDVRELRQVFSHLETKQLPFATAQAINDSLFWVTKGWEDEIVNVFDRPALPTVRAVNYRKASKDRLFAEAWIRNEAPKGGTPPSRYLLPEIQGGPREEKPFEFRLREAGWLGANEFLVPTRFAPLDGFGNVPGSVIRTILSDLQASRDEKQRSTKESRAKRQNRRAIAKRATYFMSIPSKPRRNGQQHLPHGIFAKTQFSSGSSLTMIFHVTKGAPTYRARFQAYALAERLWAENFPRAFRQQLATAIANAKP